ncbi:resistance protein [Musa troglodytarum]|uniref:Resistance protein n=1 Tax=Musa troglodytarum TaxID=320322 RepID=A0A9E7G627_9LILI|nr:resistance protein [Musa troglodytarum]
MKGKWDELKHKLLRVGGMGSTVIITTNYWRPERVFGCTAYWLDGLSADAWIKLIMRVIHWTSGAGQGEHLYHKFSTSICRATIPNTCWLSLAGQDVGLHIQEHRDYLHMMIAEDLMPQQSFDAEKMYRLVPQLELEFETLGSDYYLTTRMGQDSIRIPEQCCHLCLFVGDASTFPTALSSAGGIKRLRTLILQTDEELFEEGKKCQIREIPAAMFTNLDPTVTSYDWQVGLPEISQPFLHRDPSTS